ncbi:MAG: 4'-phosphopantetheinyl transferase superfamily protein [Candidatus Dormibacteria bacterium]|jgi:4'-phosphopantetheinyl transferase
MLSRAALRGILSHYLGSGASELSFVVGPHGKPALGGDAAGRVHFNLSHSGGVALVGVSSDREVGVDVERIRADLDEMALARLALGVEAVTRLEASEPERRTVEFFRFWVRHEAAIKCRGVALGKGKQGGEDGLLVEDAAVGAGYAAAFAVAVGVEGVERWDPALVGCWAWDG